MNIADVLAALLRRWQLTVAGLIASALMCAGALLLIGPTYEDKSTVLLLPPGTSLTTGENPYLGLSGLNQMVDVLVRTAYSQPTRLAVQERWPSAEFTVEPDLETSGPLISITVRNASAAQAQELTRYLLNLLPEQLEKLQADLHVRPRSMITADVLTQYAQPEVIRSKQLRAGIVVAGVGLVGTVLLIGLIDRALLNRWRGADFLPAPRAVTAPTDPPPALLAGTSEAAADGWGWGEVEAGTPAPETHADADAESSRPVW